MEDILKKLNENDVFIRVSSKKEDDYIIKFAKENGYKYYDGKEFSSVYDIHKNKTTYSLKGGCYATLETLEQHKIKYVEFEDIFGKIK